LCYNIFIANFYSNFSQKNTSQNSSSKMSQLHKSGPKWVMYSSMGLELGLSVIVGFLIGSWLDEWLDTEPWFLLVFGIAGITAGYRSIFRLVKRVNADAEAEKGN
jgi:F0F1-type ATP synthase assembly protein I